MAGPRYGRGPPGDGFVFFWPRSASFSRRHFVSESAVCNRVGNPHPGRACGVNKHRSPIFRKVLWAADPVADRKKPSRYNNARSGGFFCVNCWWRRMSKPPSLDGAGQAGEPRRDAERPRADDSTKALHGTAPAARAALPVIVRHLSGPWMVMPAAWALSRRSGTSRDGGAGDPPDVIALRGNLKRPPSPRRGAPAPRDAQSKPPGQPGQPPASG